MGLLEIGVATDFGVGVFVGVAVGRTVCVGVGLIVATGLHLLFLLAETVAVNTEAANRTTKEMIKIFLKLKRTLNFMSVNSITDRQIYLVT